MLQVSYRASSLGSSLEHFCLERNIQDQHVLSRHFVTVQVYLQFVETDRATPNTACAELDSDLIEKKHRICIYCQERAHTLISKTFLRRCLWPVVLRNVISTMLPSAETSRTDLYRAESCRGMLLRAA